MHACSMYVYVGSTLPILYASLLLKDEGSQDQHLLSVCLFPYPDLSAHHLNSDQNMLHTLVC